MPRKLPKNFKRPERVTHTPEVVQEQAAARDIMKQIPAHYIESIRNNTAIKPCCRDTANLTFHTEKTDPSFEKPNKGVFTCSVCSCKQIRMIQGSGKVGG